MDVIGLDLSGKDPKPLLPPLVDGLSDYLRQAMDRLIGVGKVLRDRIDRAIFVHLSDHVDPHREIYVRVLNERPFSMNVPSQ
jgi:hypothetical protein